MSWVRLSLSSLTFSDVSTERREGTSAFPPVVIHFGLRKAGTLEKLAGSEANRSRQRVTLSFMAVSSQSTETGLRDSDRMVVRELYGSLALLGADNGLLGIVGSWPDSLSSRDVADVIRHWNEATLRELRERIEHHEISCRRTDCSRGEDG